MATELDLTQAVGFPVRLDPDSGRLRCLPPAQAPAEDPRPLAAMRPVLRDRDAPGPDPLYWMYRGAGVPAEDEAARSLGLRYDLTVLRAGRVGAEAVKTFGHVHPPAPGGLAYPEVYQVVHGRAWVLLQRERRGVAELLAVAAGPGDVVVIPPGYAHATVNAGEGPVVLANWVYEGFASDYGPVAARGGLAWFWLADPPGWERNPSYSGARLRELPPAPPALLGLRPGEPLYALGTRDPERLRFLADPAAHAALWRELAGAWGAEIPGTEDALP